MPPQDQDSSTTPLTFSLKSDAPSSIEELTPMRRALLFAELSSISYFDHDDVNRLVEILGFQDVTFFDRDGSQAYAISNGRDRIIACRGTEPNEWNDIKADANAGKALAETVGRVHRGFKQEVDDLWPMLESHLTTNELTLWFTGHSLGGAMATICAGRCMLSQIKSNPSGLFTYGSPRVGTKRYINYFDISHERWVNNNDIVTRVPPAWLGFRHHGLEMYLNRYGRLQKMNGWTRTRDRLKGFLGGLKEFSIDHFSDHSIDRYIENIWAEVCGAEGRPIADSAAPESGE